MEATDTVLVGWADSKARFKIERQQRRGVARRERRAQRTTPGHKTTAFAVAFAVARWPAMAVAGTGGQSVA